MVSGYIRFNCFVIVYLPQILTISFKITSLALGHSYVLLYPVLAIFFQEYPMQMLQQYTGVHMAPYQGIFQHMPYSYAAMLWILKSKHNYSEAAVL